MPSSKRILVADVPEGVQTIKNVLGTEAEILGASTLKEAKSLLDQGADLVVCGIHFDDSRMFDLLRISKADPLTRRISFLCFRDMNSQLAAPVLQGLQIACTALGATAFVDLFDLKMKHGIQQADERFRRMLRELLLR